MAAPSSGHSASAASSSGGGGSKDYDDHEVDHRADTRLIMMAAKRKLEADKKREVVRCVQHESISPQCVLRDPHDRSLFVYIQLSTRAMREKERLAREKVYTETVIRIQFPDRHILQVVCGS